MIASRFIAYRGLLLVLYLFFVNNAVQAQSLSPRARISLITCSPGDELYSMYGHSAIRVNDPDNGIDYVFNYGTFDFRTPNFYPKFVMGKLKYKLAISDFQDFLAAYQYYNRSVYEQILNLTLPQKNEVFRFLQTNYLPENREYLYDFFFDNCATRIRDVFTKTLQSRLKFDPVVAQKKQSFRQIVGIYQNPFPWADFGVDLAMGLPSDQKASVTDYMFIPDYLQESFAKATVDSATGKYAFAQPVTTLFKATAPPPATGSLLTPIVFCWILLGLGALLTFWQWQQKRAAYTFDIIIFSITGVLGCVLLFLTTSSEYKAFPQNLNLLWTIPLHLPAALLLSKRNTPHFLKIYFLGTAGLMGLLLILWRWFPQEYHPAFFPLILLLGLRAAFIYLQEKQKKKRY